MVPTKLMALVLIGMVMGLGLVFLPTLGTTSFSPFGSANQYATGENKNTSGSGALDGNGIQPAAVESYGVYRSISESPVGPFGVPAAVLALGVVVAAGAYLLSRRRVP